MNHADKRTVYVSYFDIIDTCKYKANCLTNRKAQMHAFKDRKEVQDTECTMKFVTIFSFVILVSSRNKPRILLVLVIHCTIFCLCTNTPRCPQVQVAHSVSWSWPAKCPVQPATFMCLYLLCCVYLYAMDNIYNAR